MTDLYRGFRQPVLRTRLRDPKSLRDWPNRQPRFTRYVHRHNFTEEPFLDKFVPHGQHFSRRLPRYNKSDASGHAAPTNHQMQYARHR